MQKPFTKLLQQEHKRLENVLFQKEAAYPVHFKSYRSINSERIPSYSKFIFFIRMVQFLL